MNIQFSAGGIVYQKARSASSGQEKTFILVSQHSQHHGWVFPKGLIGDHVKEENKEETALREVKEETGVEGKIVKALTPVDYWFAMEGDPSTGSGREKIRKTVYYFLMEYVGGNIAQHDHEMEAVVWLPKEKVAERLTYKSDKKVWCEAIKILN
jgi:8-oxo-dGTP diphosphatase